MGYSTRPNHVGINEAMRYHQGNVSSICFSSSSSGCSMALPESNFMNNVKSSSCASNVLCIVLLCEKSSILSSANVETNPEDLWQKSYTTGCMFTRASETALHINIGGKIGGSGAFSSTVLAVPIALVARTVIFSNNDATFDPANKARSRRRKAPAPDTEYCVHVHVHPTRSLQAFDSQWIYWCKRKDRCTNRSLPQLKSASGAPNNPVPDLVCTPQPPSQSWQP